MLGCISGLSILVHWSIYPAFELAPLYKKSLNFKNLMTSFFISGTWLFLNYGSTFS
jgi:hypothetical protein